MGDPVYCACGGLLLEEVTPEGVRPAGAARPIGFRRLTDYVICPDCMSVYSVSKLREGLGVGTPEPEEERDAEIIDKLEKLARERGVESE